MTKYHNPIIPGFHPDPSICRVGDDYYLVTSSFEYFPCLPVFHSRDLVNWMQIGHAVERPEAMDLGTATCFGGNWAPTIRYHNGWFYVICTNVSDKGHYIVRTQDPAAGWSDPSWITLGTSHVATFDPSLFFDDDGKVYLTYFATEGLMQALIDPDTARLLSPLRRIADSTNGFTSEGPHLYKVNGRYYLMTAEGGTEYGHMESIYRADNPWGPFTPCPHNPVLSHRSLYSPLQVTGHGDLVQDPNGNWWMVFLAVRPNGYQPAHHLGRETCLAPVVWTEDGWIKVGDNRRVSLEMDGPLPPAGPVFVYPNRTCFDQPVLDPRWVFVRNPHPGCWSLSERPRFLRLRGLPATLDEVAPIAFVGRRQEHFIVTVAACLDFIPKTALDEAGLCIRMNEGHHYEIFKSIRNGEPRLLVRRTIGTLTAETASIPWPLHESTLAIRADSDWYHFGYIREHTFTELDQAETRYLSTEVARGFNGVTFGMYATGNGEQCSAPADFLWFDYIPEPHEPR